MCIVVSSLKTLKRHNVILNFKFYNNNRSKLVLILMLIKLNWFYLNVILN